jgi:hypothetical protein
VKQAVSITLSNKGAFQFEALSRYHSEPRLQKSISQEALNVSFKNVRATR